MALFAKIITYPPLGQVTVVPPDRKDFNFTVILESSTSLPERPWEVSIWYDHSTYSGTKSPWQAVDLKPVDQGPCNLLDASESKLYRYAFTGNLESPYRSYDKTYKGRRVPFTVRYRIDAQSEWMWVWHNFGIKDGELILQPPIDPNFLGASPVELEKGWTARKLASESPDARLYSIESVQPIPIPEEGNAKLSPLLLGRVTLACRWFALVRIWQPWLAPRHGENKLRLSEHAILLSFLRSDGLHVVLLAVNGVHEVLTMFESDANGDIVVAARNDTGKDQKFRIIAASAWQFEVANCAVMYEARRQVRESVMSQNNAEQIPQHLRAESIDSDFVLVNDENPVPNESPISPEWLESWYDSLAYCTWNSLGQDLNAEKIMGGLESLEKNNIFISTLIIDDNWQSLDGEQGSTPPSDRGWMSFEANPKGFPDGLKKTIAKIRKRYPAIRDIAVWHALLGYWGCISRDGEIAQKYKTRRVKMNNNQSTDREKLVIDPDDIHRMYDDFYKFLSDCGITGVKTDAQFMLDLLEDTLDRRDLTNTFQSAWTQAHLRHLAGKAISCMSMMPQILYHSFLPTNTPRILLRNSDDFFPDIPASHPWHVFVNAHNAIFVQHLNVLPDWDMFQTSHPYSEFHAAARCVSGGPIYITDTPGQHNIDLIHQMTALNTRGQTVILRPSNVGKTIDVYDKYDDKGILKVGVYDGKSEIGTGILGVFNIAEQEVNFVLPITKFPGVDVLEDRRPRKWVVRSHIVGSVTKPITPVIPAEPSSLLQATLPIRGYDIWSALPVHTFQLSTKSLEIAVIGLLGKMTGACAIIEVIFTMAENGRRLKCHVQLKALGRLGIWVSDARQRNVEDFMVLLKGKAVPQGRVSIVTKHSDGEDTGVLEIDVEGAWNDLKPDIGWSNEVGLDIFFG